MATISESISQSNVNGRARWATVKQVLSYGILFLLALTFIYPFLLAIATSFKTLPEINQYPVSLIPKVVT